MKADGKTVQEILANLPAERAEQFNKLHRVIVENLPIGFEPSISYGGLGYVVPHALYPSGYHCKPSEPLPFAGISSQWFVNEYQKHSKLKLDMGKSCVRFKKIDEIPYDLIGELMKKMSVEEWINIYESNLKKGKANS